MENTEAKGITAAAAQTQTNNLSNLDNLGNLNDNLNNYYDGTYTIPNEWLQNAPISTSSWTTFSDAATDASSKLDEIKEHLNDSLEAVNDKINSILDLIKENEDFIDTYNNMLQYLIGQKQTIINMQKLFFK